MAPLPGPSLNASIVPPCASTRLLAIARVERHIEISVSDTGAGIEPTMMSVIFERLRRTQRERQGRRMKCLDPLCTTRFKVAALAAAS